VLGHPRSSHQHDLSQGNPQVLHASRKRRIASGSGTSVQEINKLLKQYKQMQIMMKRVKKMGGAEKFMARGLPQGLLQR
jgi:signal recognition particle subunit SRP54